MTNPSRRLRQRLTTLTELLCSAAIAGGVAMHDTGAGLVVGGALGIGLSVLASLPAAEPDPDGVSPAELTAMLANALEQLRREREL